MVLTLETSKPLTLWILERSEITAKAEGRLENHKSYAELCSWSSIR